ncbi:MAG TPA: zf-HC2 domain-containing protein [Terriglobales bacterium]|nr:zf-HC2 domain-containing protein [Terriglobales bacterium]
MKHIAQEILAAFVRESLSAKEGASVQAHLDQCPSCSESAELFRKVERIGTKDASYEPPDGIVRTAKAYFQTQRQKAPQGKSAFELLFDSFAQPMVQGARASVASARQLLYRVGTVYVDMRVDSEQNSERAALVGQMLDSARPGNPVSGVPVILMDGRKSVASTISNNNGEFHLEFALKNNLRLSVTVGDSVPVYLPITGIEERKRPAISSRGPN